MSEAEKGGQDYTGVDAAAGRPTRVRYWVLVCAVTLSVITAIDRVCISQAAPLIREDLGLTTQEMGWAFSAFFWAYALFEVPSGWLGDRIGARKVLMRIVVWWSFFTSATGWAFNLVSLLVTRTLFGVGEAGCYPNLTKVFTTWLPRGERVRAQGLMWLSSRWGAALTPLLVAMILEHISWRHTFELFGVMGVVWAIFFYIWYRDNPRERKEMNEAEKAMLPRAEEVMLGQGKVPWGEILKTRTVWLLWVQYACLCFGAVFYFTWLPTYLREGRGLEMRQGALLAAFPLFFGGLGSLFCGYISAPVARRMGSVAAARRWIAWAGFVGASACLALSSVIPNAWAAMVVMGLAGFCNDLVMPTSWGTCMDIGGKFAGTISGSMNMMGNLGAALASLVTGYILVWFGHNWNIVLYVAAAVYFGGAFCWLALDPVTPIERS